MKRIITATWLILAGIMANAHTDIDTATLINALNQAPFIFEGKVIEECTYEEPSTGIIYTNNIMEITKVIKGNLNCGTVSMITEGGEYLDRYMEVTHTTQFNINVQGIFACNPNPYYYGNSCPSTSNTQIMTPMLREFSEIHYYDDYVNEIAEGFNSQFHDINELYDFIQNIAGLTFTDCNPLYRPQDWGSNDWKYQKLWQDQNLVDNSAWKTTSGESLRIFLDTAQRLVTDTGIFEYYYLPILVQSNQDSTYLDEIAFRLQFDKHFFDTANTNNLLGIILGSNFSSATYNNIVKQNKGDSVISIWIKQAVPNNRTRIDTLPDTLMTLKFFVNDCSYFPKFKFVPVPNVLSYCQFTTSANAPSNTALQYNTFEAIDSSMGISCIPRIDSLYGNSSGNNIVNAGNEQILTIKGKYFLNPQGTNNRLFFANATDGGQTFTPLDNYDIQSWTDTLIQAKLPGDVVFGQGNATTGYNVTEPGSGYIKIQNKYGSANHDSSNSIKNKVQVNWSLISWHKTKGDTTGFYKTNALLFPPSASGSYTFRIDNNITNPNMIRCIYAAIEHWRCAIGVNFQVDTINKISASIADDTINLIKINASKGILQTFRWVKDSVCTPINAQHPKPVSNIDIAINPINYYNDQFSYDETGAQNVPSGKYDFYMAILHELGHAVGLNHVMDSLDLMWWFAPKGIIQSNQRKTKSGYNNQVAGSIVVNNSTNMSSLGVSCLGQYHDMTAVATGDSCQSSPTNTHTVQSINNEVFRYYPNPTHQNFTIELFSSPQDAQVEIFDLMGKSIYTSRLRSTQTEIDLYDIPSGIYIIKIKNNEAWQTERLIKL